jgi:DNA repair exonuclease SbcCD ATPase subunit
LKLLSGQFTNFGSYKSVDLDFETNGLVLVQGATGSGKSTIPDMVAWALFGITAKGGSVDDVRSWSADGEPTTAELDVETPDGILTIVRVRGAQTQNDLHWIEHGQPGQRRGKDITETQKLLQDRLGVSPDLYLYAAYFSEFSPTGSFFVAKAKERRELFENLASLDLPIKIADKVSDERKQLKKSIDLRDRAIAKVSGKIDQLRSTIEASKVESTSWASRQKKVIQELRKKSNDFEEDTKKAKSVLESRIFKLSALVVPESSYKNRIAELQAEKTCSHCGGVSKAKMDQIQKLTHLDNENKSLLNQIQTLMQQLQETRENKYDEQIKIEETKSNPFEGQTEKLLQESKTLESDLSTLESEFKAQNHKLFSLNQLYDLSFQLRGELLRRAVQSIEDSTNQYLETYFDSPIRVKFSIEDSDKLEVEILKSGYNCNYRQLSKGQRGLLKLCFGVSVMESASNRAGVHFDQVFMDEPTDGLDSDLKVKAYSLFEYLAINRDSVFVIEHNENLQAMFSRTIKVELINDQSEIYKDYD